MELAGRHPTKVVSIYYFRLIAEFLIRCFMAGHNTTTRRRMHTPKVIIHRLHVPLYRRRSLRCGLLSAAALITGCAAELLATLGPFTPNQTKPK